MTSVNSKISEFLGTDYILGVGYFLKIAQSVDEDAPLELWKNHLEPLLTDYLRGMDDADGKLQEIREAFDKGDPSNTTDQPAQGDAAPTTGSDLGSSEA